MTAQNLSYFLLLFLAPTLSLGVGIYAWKQRATPGRRTFAVMMFAVAWWGLFYAFQLLAGPNLEAQVFWNKIRQIGSNAVAPHFLIFVLYYTSNEKWLTRRVFLAMGLPTALVILLGLTNDWHHLYWENFALAESGPFTVLVFERGLANLTYIAFSYLQIVVGMAFLFRWVYINSQRLYRLQVAAFVVGVFAPWVGNIVFSLGLSRIDPTSFAFTLTGLGFAWAIFRYQLLDLAPVARERVIENLEDAMVVLNLESQVVDLNQTARTWLELPESAAVLGQPARKIFARWLPVLDCLNNEEKGQKEFTIDTGEEERAYEIRISPLASNNGRKIGRLILIRDITVRRRAEQALREAQLKYKSLAEQIPAATYMDEPDATGTASFISPRIEAMLGYPMADWERDAHFWHKLVFPADYEAAAKIIQKTLENGHATTEYRMVAQDGRPVWIQDESVLIRDDQGKPLWVQGVLFDISKRKHAEATQQAFLEDMKALQEVHLTLSTIEDVDNLYIQMVSQAKTRLGFERLGLFALDHTTHQLLGTFGIGPEGEIRDERYYTEPVTDDHWTLEIFKAPKRTKLWENAPLYDNAQEVGLGWKAAATLWNGRQAVGYIVCDNFISRRPARPYETELLSILGSIYGHLIERKQTEALLQASETRFRQIIENASDIIYRTDAAGKFIYANPTALRVMGFEAEEEILGRDYLDLARPEQREHLRQTYRTQIYTKTPNSYHEFAALTADGHPLWLGQNVQLIMEGNRATGFQAVAHDITKRKQAEAQADERAAHLSTLNRLGREIIATLDLTQICAAAREAVEALMPVDAFYIALYDEAKQEIEDLYLFDKGQIWPNARGPLSEHGLAGKVVQTAQPLLIEDDLDMSDKRILFGTDRDTRSVMVVPLSAEGKIIGIISAQHYDPHMYAARHLELLELLGNQVAIALRNAHVVKELRLQAAMLAAAANAIAIIDLDGTILWVNPAFTLLTGYTFEEAVGQNTRILRSGKHPSEFYQPLYKTILSGKIWQGNLINRRKDGTFYYESQTITPVFDEAGQLFRFITIKQDITELIQTRDQALEASRFKSQLLSRVSHELRTPLGGILGYAELLAHDMFGPLDEKQRQATRQIMDSANYLNTMVNELLDEAQLSAGSLFLRVTPFSPAHLMGKVEGFLSVIARKKGLSLTTSVSDELTEVWGDEQRLQQILTNLIGNAIKFTNTGEVRAEMYPFDASRWALKVSDTGPGIAPEAQDLIFEPFRQVDDSITRENRGTGLGLSITKQLVEFMGGCISLESQVGQGSTFTLLFPYRTETEKPA